MKFISYHIDNEEQVFKLDTRNSNLNFDSLTKEDALEQFEHHKFAYRPINGLHIGMEKKDQQQVKVYVPLNSHALNIVQEFYYFLATFIITAMITVFMYSLLSIDDSGQYFNFAWLYEFYQHYLILGFNLSPLSPAEYNTFANAFLFTAPVFIFFEVLISIPIYLSVRPYTTFLPASILNLIFDSLFKRA
ncbi:hypothetical protein MJH12_18145 [bacterium]|nr:hypothetical protein [bacterium]